MWVCRSSPKENNRDNSIYSIVDIVDREYKGSMFNGYRVVCCMGKTAPIAKLSPTATSEQIE